MTVRGRKRIHRLGPLTLNLVSQGFWRWRLSSWSIKVWRLGWNSRLREPRFDVPGPWTWTPTRRRR
jgi:hypothetical protein